MFERLDQTSSGENMSYLKCLVYVRPTRENVDLLVRELQKPRYGNYYICELWCYRVSAEKGVYMCHVVCKGIVHMRGTVHVSLQVSV